MNKIVQNTEELIVSALNWGEVIEPRRLLDVVEQLSSPLNFLIFNEPEAEPFEVFRLMFPALPLRRREERVLSLEEKEKAVGLIRWALGELSTWTCESDPRLVKIAAVMVVLYEFDWIDAHWALLSNTGVNSELIQFFCGILKNYRSTLDCEPGSRSAKTNNLGASLAKADKDEDWVAISASWPQLETWLRGGLLLDLAVPYFARFDMSGLASAMDEVSQIQDAYLIARSLSEANRVKLARTTSSQRYRFAAVLSIAWSKNRLAALSDEAENELTALLEDVAKDADQWPRWMRAFNEYPMRFPALQLPLGRALAQASANALASYVESISLYARPLDRPEHGQLSLTDGSQSVANCLKAFRESATLEQRCTLWQIAETRWEHWNFGLQSSSEGNLIWIVGSELDYAITAHAAECLTVNKREALLASLVKEIRDIEMGWHSSIMELQSRRNVFLSRMQPLLVEDDADWLFLQPIIPSEIIQNPYTQRKFE